jgi:hypothetical protein
MADRKIRFRVWYAGGTTDEWVETISDSMFQYYSDGGKGHQRLCDMAEGRDYQGRKVNLVTMAQEW